MLDFPVDPTFIVLHPDGRVTYSARPATQPIAVTVHHLLTAELDQSHRAEVRTVAVSTGWCADLLYPDLPDNRIAGHVLDNDLPSQRWHGPVAMSWRPEIESALDAASEHGLTVTREPTLRNDALMVHPHQLIDHLAERGWQFRAVRCEVVFVSIWRDPSNAEAVISAPLSNNTPLDLMTMYFALRDLAELQERGVGRVIEEIAAAAINLSPPTPQASSAQSGRDDESTPAEQHLRADFDVYHGLRHERDRDSGAQRDAQTRADRWLLSDDADLQITWLDLDTLAAAEDADSGAMNYLHAVILDHPGSAEPIQLRNFAHIRDLVPTVHGLDAFTAAPQGPAVRGTPESNATAISGAELPATKAEFGPGL